MCNVKTLSECAAVMIQQEHLNNNNSSPLKYPIHKSHSWKYFLTDIATSSDNAKYGSND